MYDLHRLSAVSSPLLPSPMGAASRGDEVEMGLLGRGAEEGERHGRYDIGLVEVAKGARKQVKSAGLETIIRTRQYNTQTSTRTIPSAVRSPHHCQPRP